MHRVGPDLLEKQLPKRNEFAVSFQLSEDQETLYMKFLEVGVRGSLQLIPAALCTIAGCLCHYQ